MASLCSVPIGYHLDHPRAHRLDGRIELDGYTLCATYTSSFDKKQKANKSVSLLVYRVLIVAKSANAGLPNGGNLEVGLSSVGTLCTLTEVQSDPSNPSTDIQIIPIGGLYDGRPWENVAGSYSEAIFPNGPPSCMSMECTITLPAEASNSRYILTS